MGQYTTEGKTVRRIREESRRYLALTLVYVFASIFVIAICVACGLMAYEVVSFDNGLTLILAITAPFSGLLGSAITFYFSNTTASV